MERGHTIYLPFIVLIFAVLFTFPACRDETENTVSALETHIREILGLPTYEHIYRDIIYVGEEASFLMFKTVDTKLLFSIDVKVQAGIDLKDGIKLVPGNNGSITVHLPPPKILLVDADENSIHQYFLKEMGKSITRLDYYDEINRQKAEIEKDAVNRNILYKAEENAKKLIKKFLILAGFEEVNFKTIKVRGAENDTSEKAKEAKEDVSA